MGLEPWWGLAELTGLDLLENMKNGSIQNVRGRRKFSFKQHSIFLYLSGAALQSMQTLSQMFVNPMGPRLFLG